MDFGSWILDFGVWILDQFSLRSFCGGPKRRRLEFGFWSLDFGFRILDFGLDEASTDIVWILHKIFPCHADSGRRISGEWSWHVFCKSAAPKATIKLIQEIRGTTSPHISKKCVDFQISASELI